MSLSNPFINSNNFSNNLKAACSLLLPPIPFSLSVEVDGFESESERASQCFISSLSIEQTAENVSLKGNSSIQNPQLLSVAVVVVANHFLELSNLVKKISGQC
ncbi:hypothetical protein ACQ4LE_008850 [Meloidogyne hapla]